MCNMVLVSQAGSYTPLLWSCVPTFKPEAEEEYHG